MPTPPQAGQQGVWSLRQAHEALGLPDRLLRRASARGLISPDGLDGADLLALRLLGASALPGRDPEVEGARDRETVRNARAAYDPAGPDWILLLTDAESRLAADADALAVLVRAYPDRPRLLLPVGAWAEQIRRLGAGGPR